MTRCFITGRTSYLGRSLADMLSRHLPVRLIGLTDLAAQEISADDIVINAAFRIKDYREDMTDGFGCDDAASSIAERLGARYIMLSTRAVYESRLAPPLSEENEPAPSTAYGRNKARIERELQQRLGERLLILRLSNVFGRERAGRRTFISTATDSLAKRDVVELDISAETRKDFVPIDFVGEALLVLVRQHAHGIYNVASGIALPIGTVAQALIDGWGKGRLIVTSARIGEQFALSIEKLKTTTGLSLTDSDVLDSLRKAAHDHVIQ